MEKIVYLLGAGASANALPVVKANSKERNGLPYELSDFVGNQSFQVNNSFCTKRDLSVYKEIASKSIEFGTPDLYAKFLLETYEIGTYEQLKDLMSAYFSFKEQEEKAFDKRALAFLTSIASKNKLPNNVKILSWNYDTQIELAANKLIPKNPGGITFIQNFSTWPNQNIRKNDDDFFLLHINGVAGYENDADSTTYFSRKSHKDLNPEKRKLLSFAWEDDSIRESPSFIDKRVDIIKKMVKDATILVIIGYSFPFFNREIDNRIFEALSPTLKKIYFQDPNLDGNFLYDRYYFLRNHVPPNSALILEREKIPIISIKNTEQYLIPIEL